MSLRHPRSCSRSGTTHHEESTRRRHHRFVVHGSPSAGEAETYVWSDSADCDSDGATGMAGVGAAVVGDAVAAGGHSREARLVIARRLQVASATFESLFVR